MRSRGWIEADRFEWSKVKHFCIYVVAFAGGTWSNMKILTTANVETIIVFRACTPLFVCIFDYLFHRRELPSVRSAAAMLVILAGAASYVLSDRSLQIEGGAAYFWVAVWMTLLVFQLTYSRA